MRSLVEPEENNLALSEEAVAMVISHKYKYVFIEVPHTASTAIHRELCRNYDGVLILRKHSLYSEFRRIASPEERKYFVFAGVRNPLDDAVSCYFKYKTNHRGEYTDPSRLATHGGCLTKGDVKAFDFIRDSNAEFAAYFRGTYRLPYSNMISLAYRHCDFIIRFENLQEDFSKALDLIGIEQKRPLPRANPTGERADAFLSYYTPEIREQAKWVFGPFLKKWGYGFPLEWGETSVPWWNQVAFDLVDKARVFYWEYLRWSPSPFVRSIVARLR